MKKNGFISMTLVYTFLVLFMFLMLAILATYSNKDKYLETINSQIDKDISNNMKTKKTLLNAILKDNTPYQYSSKSNDKTTYSFNLFNISNAEYHNGNGLFYNDSLEVNDEDNNGVTSRIYFFRGNLETNHLIFAGFCWRIIRSNEDGGLRIRYNGKIKEGTCPKISDTLASDISIGKVKYSDTDNKVKYVTKSKKDQNGNYIADANNPHSNIKELLDNWYRDNILNKKSSSNESYDTYVQGAVYCNDTSGRINDLVPSYKGDDRNVYDDSNVTITGTFKCEQQDDQNTKYSQPIGNKLLNYPIGTLTAQDLVFAGAYMTSNNDIYRGGLRGMNNTSFYLYSNESFWTMSAVGNEIVIFDSHNDGSENIARLQTSSVTSSHNVIPVISLKPSNEISGGTGTSTNPYVIKY